MTCALPISAPIGTSPSAAARRAAANAITMACDSGNTVAMRPARGPPPERQTPPPTRSPTGDEWTLFARSGLIGLLDVDGLEFDLFFRRPDFPIGDFHILGRSAVIHVGRVNIQHRQRAGKAAVEER